MELKDPKAKGKSTTDNQPAFPIFIESELGLSIDNWVPIVCTGQFNGLSIVVESPAEISALHAMGNFGKGSNSRSKPYISRTDPELPPFMRERQYAERMKWTDPEAFTKTPKKSVDNNSLGVVKELHSVFEDLLSKNIICRNNESVEESNQSDVIELLSSDEDCTVDTSQSTSGNKDLRSVNAVSRTEKAMEVSDNFSESAEERDIDVKSLKFPPKSVIVLPDSDSEKDDYFKDLKLKVCIDESDLFETLILMLEEAYFLAYGLGCLQILDESKKLLSLEESWSLFCGARSNFPIHYAVYHHFRSKGWIVKPGIKFGGDFLLYKKGQPFYHASYIVFVQKIIENKFTGESTQFDYDWMSIQNFVRMSGTTGKEILFASVVIPEEVNTDKCKRDPDFLKKISVCETLFRRWTSSQEKNDDT